MRLLAGAVQVPSAFGDLGFRVVPGGQNGRVEGFAGSDSTQSLTGCAPCPARGAAWRPVLMDSILAQPAGPISDRDRVRRRRTWRRLTLSADRKREIEAGRPVCRAARRAAMGTWWPTTQPQPSARRRHRSPLPWTKGPQLRSPIPGTTPGLAAPIPCCVADPTDRLPPPASDGLGPAATLPPHSYLPCLASPTANPTACLFGCLLAWLLAWLLSGLPACLPACRVGLLPVLGTQAHMWPPYRHVSIPRDLYTAGEQQRTRRVGMAGLGKQGPTLRTVPYWRGILAPRGKRGGQK